MRHNGAIFSFMKVTLMLWNMIGLYVYNVTAHIESFTNVVHSVKC